MDDWDAKKMLDLYIYDYMCRNNMRSAAETFAQEANFTPKDVAINHTDGFLTEWWALFWDMYSARPNVNSDETSQLQDMYSARPNANSDETSQLQEMQILQSMLGNVCPEMPQDLFNLMQQNSGFPNLSTAAGPSSMAMPDIGYFLQSPETLLSNLSPSVGSSFMATPDIANFLECAPSLPNLSPNIGPSLMDRPEDGKFPQSPLTATVPRFGQSPDRSGIPALDSGSTYGPNVTRYREARMREHELAMLPAGEMHFNFDHLGISQSASVIPSSSNPGCPQSNSCASNQLSIIQDANSGTNTRRSFLAPGESTARGTRVSNISAQPMETGSSLSSNSASCHPSSEELDDTSNDMSI